MTAGLSPEERLAAIQEVEGAVEKLVANGWKRVRLVCRDEESQPFKVHVTLALDGESALEGQL